MVHSSVPVHFPVAQLKAICLPFKFDICLPPPAPSGSPLIFIIFLKRQQKRLQVSYPDPNIVSFVPYGMTFDAQGDSVRKPFGGAKILSRNTHERTETYENLNMEACWPAIPK
jgi:hypothetical protein